MGRYKLGPDGAYYDAEDDGPDQASPEQIAALQGGQATPQASTEAPEETEGAISSSSPSASPSNPSSPSSLESQLYQLSDSSVMDGFDPAQTSPSMPDGSAPSPYTQPAPTVDTTSGAPWGTQPGSNNTGITGGAVTGPIQSAGAQPTYAYMEGVDTAKMNDPSHQSEKYIASRILASGGTIQDAAASIGATVISSDKIRLKSGEIVDIYRDEEGVHQLQWTPMGGQPGDPGATGAGAGVAGAAGGAAGGGGAAGMFGSGPVADAIMRLLGRGERGTGADDPNIAGPTSAFRAQQERSTRQSRNALAERSAAEGLNYGGQGSGAFDSAIQSQQEQAGLNTANYEGHLITDEIASKRQDVINALQLAQGEERIYLQQYLAQLNDQLQRAQMGQQNQQFYDEFTYRQGRDAYDRSANYYRDQA